MAKIEKIENVMTDDKITKVLMSINDGEKITEGEIYLAFLDMNTNKRYVVYTTEQPKDENDRVAFTLSTLSLEENGYILEETSKDDHQNIELPILNIIGLNNDKNPEEVQKMIDDKFNGIVALDLKQLKTNVENMTISETKPPKKANMPIAIANVIKKFYLYQLNKELNKIYSATEMSLENKNISVEKLDEIEEKLDSVKEVYKQNAEKRGGTTAKIEKSLDQIETAKKDIEAAKNRIENLPNEYVEESTLKDSGLIDEQPAEEVGESVTEMKSENNSEVEESIEEIESENVSKVVEGKEETISNTETKESLEETVEQAVEEKELEKVEQSETIAVEEEIENNSATTEKSEEKINEESIQNTVQKELQTLIGKSVDEFATNFEILINKLSNGIAEIYQKQLDKKDDVIESLNQQLKQQEEINKQEKKEMLEQITVLGQKANEVNQQAIHSKETIEGLNQQLTISQKNEEELKKENENLTGEVTSQKQLLDQQNALINSLREESKNRDEQQQAEILRLQNENKSLKIYEEGYNKIAGMFVGKGMPEPAVDPEQKLIEETVDYVISQQK